MRSLFYYAWDYKVTAWKHTFRDCHARCIYHMSVWRSFYSFHVSFFYFMSYFIDLWLPKLGYHNTFLSSASVPDTHNMLVVFVVGSPFWRYLIFISFNPMRSIYIKYLYSIIFNIRALICLIWCLYNNDVVAFCDFMRFVFPSIFDSKRLL